jgi:excisionase family DNA binding protein
MLTIEDIAEILKVSRRTVERMLSAREFPEADTRIRRMMRWRRDTLDRWISEN